MLPSFRLRRPGLLGKLMAAVRPEFRADVLVFDADGPGVRRRRLPGRGLRTVRPRPRPLPGPPPAVGRRGPPGPGRVRRDDRSAVASSNARTPAAGSPDAATVSPAAGCVSCTAQRWAPRRASRPGHLARSTRRRSQPSHPGATCRIDALRPVAAGRAAVLPQPRQHLEGQRARPTSTVFVAGFARGRDAGERDRSGSIGCRRQPRLEIGYALQCRRDQPSTKTAPSVVMALVKLLAATNACCLCWAGPRTSGGKVQAPGPQPRTAVRGRC